MNFIKGARHWLFHETVEVRNVVPVVFIWITAMNAGALISALVG